MGNKLSKDDQLQQISEDLMKESNDILYLPSEKEIEGYEWSELYKAPDSTVKVNWDHMQKFWYWISERMSIWHKRTIERLPFPWTEDPILQENKFTNVFRDIDKATIYYIQNILKKMDEPCDDLIKRKKEVILNTMIYRLFIKRKTVDAIGFIYLDSWDEQWSGVKERLRKIREQGEPVFHSAYWVNGLNSANPNGTGYPKVENAFYLCEKYHDDIDHIYDIIQTGIKRSLEELMYLPSTGMFTIYEWLCDFGMSYRYVNNPVVDWTDDSYVNIGPGNRRGLVSIFVDRGNLTELECDIYLRATWKYWMKKYGYYDDFIRNMPDYIKDINLRTIEHSSCEFSKYVGIIYGVTKAKNKFKDESKDNLDELLLTNV